MMKNSSTPELDHLTEQLADVTEQLVQVVHRLDQFEAQIAAEMHKSTVHPAEFAKKEGRKNNDLECQQQRLFNPEAGP